MTPNPAVATLQALLNQVPLTQDQVQTAEDLIKACSVEELEGLGLAAPMRPVVPKGLDKLPPAQRLQAIQRVISSVHYNHAPGYMYNVSKERPFSSIMNTAREVLRDALPIKCIEAVFLGLLLTGAWSDLERLPVGFKSKCAGQVYRHIVLAVHHSPSGRWGALGISRRPDLQFKELSAASLADLMADYKACYEGCGHSLDKIRVGLPAEHDPVYTGQVCWRYCNVSCGRHPWDRCGLVLNTFADNMRILANRFKVLGFRPPSRSGGDAGERGAGRVALSGTTPEPGASRPPPAHATPARHASVSPMRRRAGITKPEDKATGSPAATLRSTQPSPSKPRHACTSAPPRPRLNPQGNSAGHGRALKPSSTLPPMPPDTSAMSKRFVRSSSIAAQSKLATSKATANGVRSVTSVVPAPSNPMDTTTIAMASATTATLLDQSFRASTPTVATALPASPQTLTSLHSSGSSRSLSTTAACLLASEDSSGGVQAQVHIKAPHPVPADAAPTDPGLGLKPAAAIPLPNTDRLDCERLFDDSSGSDVDEGAEVAC